MKHINPIVNNPIPISGEMLKKCWKRQKIYFYYHLIQTLEGVNLREKGENELSEISGCY